MRLTRLFLKRFSSDQPWVWLVILFSCLVLNKVAAAEAQENLTPIRVLAAASLTKVITPLANKFSQQTGIPVIPIYGGSGSLAKQVEQGVPADLFISADAHWVMALQKKQQVTSAEPWVGNRLVLITPASQSVEIAFTKGTLAHTWLSGYWCTGDPVSVPVGKYAQQALRQLGWWDQVKPILVSTQDVRAALTLVERGECDVGIVYASDAHQNANVHVAGLVPEKMHAPIIYPLVVLPHASANTLAFYRYLRSQEAKFSLQQAGLIPLF